MISNIKGISLALWKRGPNENTAVTWIHDKFCAKKNCANIYNKKLYNLPFRADVIRVCHKLSRLYMSSPDLRPT